MIHKYFHHTLSYKTVENIEIDSKLNSFENDCLKTVYR